MHSLNGTAVAQLVSPVYFGNNLAGLFGCPASQVTSAGIARKGRSVASRDFLITS